MLLTGEDADLRIMCGDVEFWAHSCVLSVRADFFKNAVLWNGKNEERTNEGLDVGEDELRMGRVERDLLQTHAGDTGFSPVSEDRSRERSEDRHAYVEDEFACSGDEYEEEGKLGEKSSWKYSPGTFGKVFLDHSEHTESEQASSVEDDSSGSEDFYENDPKPMRGEFKTVDLGGHTPGAVWRFLEWSYGGEYSTIIDRNRTISIHTHSDPGIPAFVDWSQPPNIPQFEDDSPLMSHINVFYLADFLTIQDLVEYSLDQLDKHFRRLELSKTFSVPELLELVRDVFTDTAHGIKNHVLLRDAVIDHANNLLKETTNVGLYQQLRDTKIFEEYPAFTAGIMRDLLGY